MLSLLLFATSGQTGKDDSQLDRRVSEDDGRFHACEPPVFVAKGRIADVSWVASREQAAFLLLLEGQLKAVRWTSSNQRLDSLVKDRTKTTLANVEGPGGRAWVYADGRVECVKK